jgi:murein tripeptide amidase MpaA
MDDMKFNIKFMVKKQVLIMKHKLTYTALIIASLASLPGCKSEEEIKGLHYDPPGSTITTDKEIVSQHKRIIYFSESQIYASNEFTGARLNDFYKENDSVYCAFINAENKPINASPWFAFKLWAKKKQDIYLRLKYSGYSHRYVPKLSSDGINWQAFDTTMIAVDTSLKTATFKITIPTDTLWISAEELITSSYYSKWEDKMAELPFVKKKTIGRSSEGRPISELFISENKDAKDYVVIIGRQHPPEVSGFFALKTFVETLAGDSETAAEFRSKHNILIIPLVNPDGVDNGHWRHNNKGVDLNRDWFEFNQPEPHAITNTIKQVVEKGGSIKFFIDFHSTQNDVFYTLSLESTITEEQNEEEKNIAKENHTLINTWLFNLQARLPDYYVNIIDTLSDQHSPTSDRWIQRTFNAPALTYEVGDETNRELIKRVAAAAAEELMGLLNERSYGKEK